MNTPEWVQQLADSSYQLFINHDPQSHLPFNAWGLLPYYGDLWLKKIHEMVIEFKKRGYNISDYLDYFPNLSSTRFIMLMNVIHYHLSDLDDPRLIMEIQDFFVASVKARAKEDLFATEKNVELSAIQLSELLEKRPIKKCNLEESKEIGKILVALASLTHGLYNDWCTDFNYEISGPYFNNEKTVLIRSFPDTRPIDIWPEINWYFKDFSIIAEYSKLSVKIAFVGCHITYSENSVENLSGYNFQVDGKDISGVGQLKTLREKLMPIAAEQYEKFMGMDFESQKIKFVYQEHYQLKKLFDLAGIGWQPSAKLLDRIKGKELVKDVFTNYNVTIDEYREIFGFNKLIKAYN